MSETPEVAIPEPGKKSNADRRREALERQRERNHVWRVNTWARAQVKIAQADEELRTLGFEPVPLFDTDFTDEQMLATYIALTAPPR